MSGKLSRKPKGKTPVRVGLRAESELQERVQNGAAALRKQHRSGLFSPDTLPTIADSLDLDAALVDGNEEQHRWDYLLGHGPSNVIIGVEPHSAKQDEVSRVIHKRKAALQQLRAHLRDGVQVARWLWVSSGSVQFAGSEKTKRLLDQNGIEFVGRKVLPKHLPAQPPAPATRSHGRRTKG